MSGSRRTFGSSPLMDRTLAVGATGGSLSAILLRLLSDALEGAPVPGLDSCPVCPVALSTELFERVDPFSLLVGILLGLALGPALDLCTLSLAKLGGRGCEVGCRDLPARKGRSHSISLREWRGCWSSDHRQGLWCRSATVAVAWGI